MGKVSATVAKSNSVRAVSFNTIRVKLSPGLVCAYGGLMSSEHMNNAEHSTAQWHLQKKRAEASVITRVKAMASINIRIDDELKARAYQELERLGVTPSELVRQAFQYVAERGQLPFRSMLVTEEDEALINTVRKRLAAPQRVKVTLDDL